MNINVAFVSGVAYIAFWVGVAVADIGEISKCGGEYEWWLPLMIFLVVAFPFICGYLAGLEEREPELEGEK